MKIITTKKAILSVIDGMKTERRGAEPVVTIVAHDGTVSIHGTHPDFTFSKLLDATTLQPGHTSFVASSLRKTMEKTKAKFPVTLSDKAIHQTETGKEEVTLDVEGATAFEPVRCEHASFVDVNGAIVGPLLEPLTLFSQADPFYTWRDRVIVKRRAEGLYFTQCNGVHLGTLFLAGDFSDFEEWTAGMSSYAFSMLVNLLPLFSFARVSFGDGTIGFLAGAGEYMNVRTSPIEAPNFSVPVEASSCQFHLNPIDKKPFEKVLLDAVRNYRDDHAIEYPDILLRFETKEQNGEYLVKAILREVNRTEETEVLTTTSPFVSGLMPNVWLPAYDLIKAMGASSQITSTKVTDRGFLLESIQVEPTILAGSIFLHGFNVA